MIKENLDDKNLVLVKHIAAVHINNVLTLNQRKIANILLKNAYNELKMGTWHTISIREVLRLLGWQESSKTTETIKADLKALNTTQLEWNILKRDKKNTWNVTTFLADAKIENGLIRYSYSLALQDMLYNPNIYAKLSLSVQQAFKTKYALVLWEFVQCEFSTANNPNRLECKFPLCDLRKILGVENKKTYNSFKALHQKILIPAIAEINLKSDLNIIMRLERTKRKVDAIEFVIEKISERTNHVDIQENIATLSNLFGVSLEQIHHDVDSYGQDRVGSALEYTNDQIRKGKNITNAAAFYKAAVKENWKRPISHEDIKNRQFEDLIKKKHCSESFEKILKMLKDNIGINAFCSWFNDFEFISEDDSNLIVQTPTAFKRDYIETHFFREVRGSIKKNHWRKKITYCRSRRYVKKLFRLSKCGSLIFNIFLHILPVRALGFTINKKDR